MKCGFVVEQLSRAVPGGIGTYVAAMCERLPALAATGGDTIYGVRAVHRPPPQLALPVREVPIPSRLLPVLWQFLKVPPVPGRPDVVFTPSLALPPKGPAKLAAFVADLAFLRVPEAFPRWGRAFHAQGLRRLRQEADLVLTCSQSSALDLTELGGIDRGRIELIPLGAEGPAQSDGAAAERRAALGLDGRPYFLWSGTQEARKNLPAVVTAARRLGDLPHRMVLVGPAGWRSEPVVSDDRITLFGALDWPDRSALYRGATAFCYPSLFEGFGLPVVEAMAHGTPVVTSNVSSLPEVAGDAALLIDPRDPEALAHALRQLAEDSALRLQCQVAGRAQASRYTWDGSARATWAALKRLDR